MAIALPEQTATLTSLSRSCGCGAKLGPADLNALLDELPASDDSSLCVGLRERDDAAVLVLSSATALVQTVDFFTPPVDDPYDFGRIAAANALSDVYAMGATPLTALNIIAFPPQQLGAEALREILHGGDEIVRAAGALIVGGHTIRDEEPKYGLAVTGIVDPARVVTISGGQEGDVLLLSKPLGTGAIITAHKHGHTTSALLSEAVETMTDLNDRAAADALTADVHAMTDVTGFGLLGHLHDLCRASGLAAEIDARVVPMIDGVRELLQTDDGVSSGTIRNLEWAARFTRVDDGLEPWERRLLADPTTSGGLLMAIAPERASQAPGQAIGRLLLGPAGEITVR